MQITSGIRSILSNSLVYGAFQKLMADPDLYTEIVGLVMSKGNAGRVLDIGCGPATILSDLQQVSYVGFDISQDYIASANSTYQNRSKTHFYQSPFSKQILPNETKFDVALMKGLLHHLSDFEAKELLAEVRDVLVPGGILITLDPVFVSNQNLISKAIVGFDRGQNIRTLETYGSLLGPDYEIVVQEERHQSFPPYDRHLMVAKGV